MKKQTSELVYFGHEYRLKTNNMGVESNKSAAHDDDAQFAQVGMSYNRCAACSKQEANFKYKQNGRLGDFQVLDELSYGWETQFVAPTCSPSFLGNMDSPIAPSRSFHSPLDSKSPISSKVYSILKYPYHPNSI